MRARRPFVSGCSQTGCFSRGSSRARCGGGVSLCGKRGRARAAALAVSRLHVRPRAADWEALQGVVLCWVIIVAWAIEGYTLDRQWMLVCWALRVPSSNLGVHTTVSFLSQPRCFPAQQKCAAAPGGAAASSRHFLAQDCSRYGHVTAARGADKHATAARPPLQRRTGRRCDENTSDRGLLGATMASCMLGVHPSPPSKRAGKAPRPSLAAGLYCSRRTRKHVLSAISPHRTRVGVPTEGTPGSDASSAEGHAQSALRPALPLDGSKCASSHGNWALGIRSEHTPGLEPKRRRCRARASLQAWRWGCDWQPRCCCHQHARR